MFVPDRLVHPSLICVRPGAYPRVEHLKGALLGQTPALPTNIRLGWKSLSGTNTSLFTKSVNYIRKKFYNIDWALGDALLEYIRLA